MHTLQFSPARSLRVLSRHRRPVFNRDESKHWNDREWVRSVVVFILPLLIYLVMRIER
ncbi:hypothetical protein EMIT0P12_70290 [Pseudomonas sp. IT-P12]